MKTIILTILFCLAFPFLSFAQIKINNGKLIEYKNFDSQYIKSRNVNIWIPENYSEKDSYSVIYMHDGQMLYDPSSTWNKQAWNVDHTIDKLLKADKIENCIIVGIWNISEDRFYDYFPQKSLSYLNLSSIEKADTSIHLDRFNADNYLSFIVNELKPFIDKNFSTKPEKEHTFLMGSSMGGLISLYGLCEYPDIFGGAACLSIHSPMITSKLLTSDNAQIFAPAFCAYLKDHLPEANTRKVYMDLGNETLDAIYIPFQNKIDEVFWNQGWKLPFKTTNYYPGTSHTENDWADRLQIPVLFLLQKAKTNN